jgi:malate dehydrogenase (oxaloacetate-decarboxylating)
MPDRPFELDQEGRVARVRLRGRSVLSLPMLNRGTAFTPAEREALGLTGLLPDGVSTIEGQLERVYAQYLRQPDDLAKNIFLGNVRDRNEILFYRLLTEHLQEMLPVVYTPTVGTAIERYSLEFSRPRGVYLSVDHLGQIETAFRNYGLGPADVDLIVATDSEGILGIGDWGVGGIAIAVGKLALYVAAAGLHPRRVIPVVLDAGTDNQALLAEEMYLGSRHPRVRGERYDELIDAYVSAATRLFPNAMLHWEDFGAANAHRILAKYADTCCTFNDDMQGTAAVVLAAALSAARAAGTPMRDQTVVIHGAGTAGIGIADALRQIMISDGLSPGQATSRFYALDSKGLLTSDYAGTMRDFQVQYARPAAEVASWRHDADGGIGLAEVVTRSRPTMLIGTSTQPGAFSEPIITEMAAHVAWPVIMPLSNADFHKANCPPVWGHTRWQRGRGGFARRGDRTPSRPSPMITAAPVLAFFTTNYMGTACVATPSTRSVDGGVIREKERSQRDIPQLCGGPLRGPTQNACTTRLREDPQQRFSQSVGVGSWPRKSALTRPRARRPSPPT